MHDLTGRAILVTGASQGIGAGIARVLGSCGASVVAHYRGPDDREGAEAALAGFPAAHRHLVAGDLAEDGAPERIWTEATAWRGRIDVLVLNAAMMTPTGGLEDDEASFAASWRDHYQVNVVAPVRLLRGAVRHFRENGGGIVVAIGSWVAHRGVTDPRMLAYAATKGALTAVMKSVARGYARDGVLAYVIAPGVVETRMATDFADLVGGIGAVKAGLAMGDMVPPSEIAGLVAFLATGKVRHLSGATLDVNGASYLR